MKSWIEENKSILISDIFSKKYWKELRINFSLALAFLTVVFLFYFSYKALSNATSEYSCQRFEM